MDRLQTTTRVLILQHPRERKVGVNTARIAHLCLPNSELRVGLDFSADSLVSRWIDDPVRPAAVLFPGSSAVDIEAFPPPHPITLVVLDGTWWQASRILKANPRLASLPRYALTPRSQSRYRVRAQPADHCVSTIEALAHALGVLERDPARMSRLLIPFDRMVETQLAHARQSAAEGRASRHHRVDMGLRPWQWLRDRSGKVVLAAGETNEWPRHAREGLPEIVHWVGVRPATGARFEAIVRPTRRLAPSCPVQVGLSRETILQGTTFAEACAQWNAFAGPEDLVCMWGKHAGDVATRDGMSLPRRLDLRAFTIRHLGRRLGEMDTYATALGVVPGAPPAQGRAGRRIAVLEAIVDGLRRRLAGG